MKKKILASTLSTVLVATTLASCGGAKDTAGDAAAPSGDAATAEQVTIQVFSNLPDRTSGQGLIEQTLFDQYMAENPNIKIEVEALEDESYKTKFKAYASGSDMPDLISMWGQPSFSDEVIDAGLIAELNPEDYKDDNFIDGSLTYFSKNDKLYGLARNTDVMAFYYNKAIFDANGVAVPTTYNELLAAADTFKNAGIIPVAMDGADKWPIALYINALYQQFAGAETATEMKNSVDTATFGGDSWNKSLDLLRQSTEAGLFQTGFETTDYGTALNLFTNGQAAMFYMGSWEMSMATNQDIPAEVRDNISIFNMPTVEGGKGGPTDILAWNGGGHAVTASSDVKDEAVKLLNYMYTPDHWSKLAWENGVCMSAQNFNDYMTGKETSLQLDFVNLVEQATSISATPFNDLGNNEFKTVSEDASSEFAIGKISNEEYLAKLASVKK